MPPASEAYPILLVLALILALVLVLVLLMVLVLSLVYVMMTRAMMVKVVTVIAAAARTTTLLVTAAIRRSIILLGSCSSMSSSPEVCTASLFSSHFLTFSVAYLNFSSLFSLFLLFISSSPFSLLPSLPSPLLSSLFSPLRVHFIYTLSVGLSLGCEIVFGISGGPIFSLWQFTNFV